MCIENSRILRSNGFGNALLHFQNLHACLNKGGFEAPDFVWDLGRRDAVTNDVIQVIAHNVDFGTGHSWRDAYSFKPNFLTRAVAYAPARVKQMSNNANSDGGAVALHRPPVAPRASLCHSSLKPALINASSSSIALSASGPSQQIRSFDPWPAASIIRP